jgi:hypothetical protein
MDRTAHQRTMEGHGHSRDINKRVQIVFQGEGKRENYLKIDIQVA